MLLDNTFKKKHGSEHFWVIHIQLENHKQNLGKKTKNIKKKLSWHRKQIHTLPDELAFG